MNFTNSETSTNSTTDLIGLMDILEVSVHGLNILFGLPIHSYIIWFIVTGAGSGLASEFFMLNLSICDIGNCLNSLLYIFPICFSGMSSFPMFLGLVFTGRPLFQSLICVERYLAVVHPVTFLKSKPLRYRLICCAAAWLITLGSCLCSLFSLTSRNDYIYIWYTSVHFLLFLSVQLFCLVAVLRALKQSGPGERRREKENHMKRQAFKIILITTVSMTITYVSYIITGFVSILVQQISAYWFASLICYILAGFVQPVLYLRRVIKLFCFFSS